MTTTVTDIARARNALGDASYWLFEVARTQATDDPELASAAEDAAGLIDNAMALVGCPSHRGQRSAPDRTSCGGAIGGRR